MRPQIWLRNGINQLQWQVFSLFIHLLCSFERLSLCGYRVFICTLTAETGSSESTHHPHKPFFHPTFKNNARAVLVGPLNRILICSEKRFLRRVQSLRQKLGFFSLKAISHFLANGTCLTQLYVAAI